MDISLNQLEALRGIARSGSFTKAARELGVTQPAVSQQIAALQRALGLTLVEVRRNRPHLTDAGRFVAERAEAIGAQVDALAREAQEYAQAQRGTLHLAATLTIGNYVLPSLLADFCRAHPLVQPSIDVANTSAVANRVRSGDASLGLVEGIVDDPELIAEPFARDRLVVVVPSNGHRLSNAAAIRARELHGEPFISREIGSGTRDLGYELLRAHGVRPRLVLELAGGEAIVNAVEAGLGIGILSERVVQRAAALRTVSILTLDDLPMEREFFLVRGKSRILPPLGQAFAAHVRQRSAMEG